MAGVSASDIQLDNRDPEATKEAKDKLLEAINGDEKRITALADEFGEEARNLRVANRNYLNAKKPETMRKLAQEARKSKCERITDSTPLDWFYFTLFGFGLHAITGLLFLLGVTTVLLTADSDAILWTWFACEGTFALFGVSQIIKANENRAKREAAKAAAMLEEGNN